MQRAHDLASLARGQITASPGDRLPVNALSVQAPPKPDDEGSAAALARAIDRLEEIVDQETAALRNRTAIDHKDLNNRKSHGLLELTRALRPFERTGPTASMQGRLSALRAKLEVNRNVIGMHLEAVREISTIVADAMREAEADGTYSASIGQRP